MSEQCVVAVYGNVSQAKSAVAALTSEGLPQSMISLATKTLKPEPEVREALESGDESAKDAAIGAGAGSLVGVLTGAVVSSVAGAGVFLLAGPVVAAAGIAGLIVGAMVGWGVHTDHIHEYDEKIKQGKTLLLAHGDPLEVAKAERVLRQTSPEHLHLHAETSADAPDV